MNFTPREMFLTKGVGVHREKLVAFEMALRKASIAGYNLVRVSSIFPPNCKIVSKQAGVNRLSYGQIVFCVLSDCDVNEKNRLAAASVGVAIPQQRSQHGYLAEHHAYGETDEEAGDYAEDMAAEMLATTLGIDYDKNLHWDERKGLWKMKDEIVTTRAITQSAVGKANVWTYVVAGAIFIM